MKTIHCEAPGCWCGGEVLIIKEVIRNEVDDYLVRTTDGGMYIATAGYTEHWKNEDDFIQEYEE